MSYSTLINEFQSIKNKGVVWNFMMENNFFEGIDSNYSNDIKVYFEKRIQQISLAIAPTDSLIILNKQVLSEMMTHNLKYKDKQQAQHQAQAQQNQAQQNQAQQNQAQQNQAQQNQAKQHQAQHQQQQQAPPLITTGDITEQRQKVFNKVLENKQSEFNSLMNSNIPDKIDFSDNADKPIGSEMDKMIAETIAWREKELNIVLQTQDQTEASKWINRDQTITPHNNNNNINKIKTLKIGPSTTLDNIVELKKSNTPEKKVSFNFSDTYADIADTSNFLSMLKKTNVNNNDNQEIKDIKIILEEVVATQQLIMSLLQKIDINNNLQQQQQQQQQ
jgi:hypothetical protein